MIFEGLTGYIGLIALISGIILVGFVAFAVILLRSPNDSERNPPPPSPPPPQGWQMRPKKEMLKSNIEVVKEEAEDSSETIQSGYFCKYCGFKNQKDAVFCNKCGKRIS